MLIQFSRLDNLESDHVENKSQQIIMKSEQKARRTYINPCNQSTAKYQYSFGKQERFRSTMSKDRPNNTFYQVPSTLIKRGGVISRAKRDCQKIVRTQVPAPGQYNPQIKDGQNKIVFAPGRDQCATSSIFYNTTISYPGPGNYDPKQQSHVRNITLTGKVKTLYETVSPGPKYNFAGTMLERNKILSKQRKKGCIKLMPQKTTKSRIDRAEGSQSKFTDANQNRKYPNDKANGYMSSTAKKSIGRSGVNASIGKEQRFRPSTAKAKVPGPGQQQQYVKKVSSFHSSLSWTKNDQISKFQQLCEQTIQIYKLEILSCSMLVSDWQRIEQKKQKMEDGREIFSKSTSKHKRLYLNCLSLR